MKDAIYYGLISFSVIFFGFLGFSLSLLVQELIGNVIDPILVYFKFRK